MEIEIAAILIEGTREFGIPVVFAFMFWFSMQRQQTTFTATIATLSAAFASRSEADEDFQSKFLESHINQGRESSAATAATGAAILELREDFRISANVALHEQRQNRAEQQKTQAVLVDQTKAIGEIGGVQTVMRDVQGNTDKQITNVLDQVKLIAKALHNMTEQIKEIKASGSKTDNTTDKIMSDVQQMQTAVDGMRVDIGTIATHLQSAIQPGSTSTATKPKPDKEK